MMKFHTMPRSSIIRLRALAQAWPSALARLAVAIAIMLAAAQLPSTVAHAETATLSHDFFRSYAVLGSPKHVVVETPGRIWFTAPDIDAIGLLQITEISDRVVEYSTRYFLTGADSEPYDLLLHQGEIWFTMMGTSALGRLTIATEELTRYAVTPASAPRGLVLAPDASALWFVTHAGDTLGRFDLATTTLQEYPYPAAGAGLETLAFNTSNQIWLTATARNEVRLFDPATETFLQPVPAGTNGAPITVVVDAFNLPWVTFSQAGDISRYAPGTLALWRRYAAPLAGGQPAGLFLQGDTFSQSVWYTLSGAGAAGFFQVRATGQLQTPHINFPLPGPNSAPWGITVAANGVAWIADSGANQLVEWRPPYFSATFLPSIVQQE